MIRAAVAFICALVVCAGLCAPLHAGQVHKDTKFGYSIVPPDEWPAPSRGLDAGWVIGKFTSKSADYYNDPSGWTWSFKPEMTVVAFVHEVINAKKVETTKGEDGETVVVAVRDPFRDYKDFLKRTYAGGGFYFSAEEETDLKGLPVTAYEIKVEKLTNTGPRLIIAWVYHMKELDVAVQFEVLEESFPKLRNDIFKSLKSFRVIEREGELPKEGLLGTAFLSRLALDKLSPEDRATRRMELEKEAHEQAVADLPKGWKKSKVGDILVLDSCNPRMAKDLAKHCEAIMTWLDENFAFIGRDEYVRAPILKVFKSDDPYSAVFLSSSLLDNIVIEYAHDPGWLREANYEHVSRRAMEIWFCDRDRELYWAMPYWLRYGLDDLFENSRCKGSRLEFPRDVYDKVRLRQAVSDGTLTPPRDLMMMGSEQFFSGRYKADEASALVRFLLIGPASASKRTRDVLWDYLKNLINITGEIEREKEQKTSEEKPTTEEEEDEYFKRKQNAWKEDESRVLEETFDRTFADWSDKDWAALDAAYKQMIDD